MVNPGRGCDKVYTVDAIAAANAEVLCRTMPVAIPGVNYLRCDFSFSLSLSPGLTPWASLPPNDHLNVSGGQSLADACARLSAINRHFAATGRPAPWNISFR
jgi:fructose-bisphosphate aldolase class 1